jgi:SHS2 domain-containing protein
MRSEVPRWEHFEHQADMGIRGWGRTRDDAFAQAALALVAVSTEPALVATRERVQVLCQAGDEEMLLYEWLNAVVYQMATRKMLFGQFKVESDGLRLRGEMLGEALEVERHQPAVEVKAATVTCLRVARESDGVWLAQCVVDV